MELQHKPERTHRVQLLFQTLRCNELLCLLDLRRNEVEETPI